MCWHTWKIWTWSYQHLYLWSHVCKLQILSHGSTNVCVNNTCKLWTWLHIGAYAHIRVEVRGQLLKIGSLLSHVGPKDGTQVIRLDSKLAPLANWAIWLSQVLPIYLSVKYSPEPLNSEKKNKIMLSFSCLMHTLCIHCFGEMLTILKQPL